MGLSHCQSAGIYYHNRVFDFTDIFHLGVEKDVYGVSGFVGPVGIGLQKADKGVGAGGRFGYIGVYNTGSDESVVLLSPDGKKEEIIKYGSCNPIICTYAHSPKFFNTLPQFRDDPYVRSWRKNMKVYFTFILPSSSKLPASQRSSFNNEYSVGYSYFPVEFSIGLYLGIRVGINFDELADFLVGLAGYDLMDDDMRPDGSYPFDEEVMKELFKNQQKGDKL